MFAGPNGSGKSTINAKVLSDPELGFDGVYINADDIAKNLERNFASLRERNVAAATYAEELRHKCLDNDQSFAFETAMSTPEKVALISQARARGFEVHLVFVTTEDPEINVQRVANRAALGGHDVPAGAIRSRYESSMRLLPVAIELATSVLVYDNSVPGRDAVLVAKKAAGGELEIVSSPNAPLWAFERLQRDHNLHRHSLASLGNALQVEGFDPASQRLIMAEAAHGLRYDGRTIAATALHILQKINKDSFVMHSRALMQDKPYQVGRSGSVTYAFDKGKILKQDFDIER